ncbi:MAG TPA: histidine phosphatase family protein [Gemmatimonadales bacterium]|nr:histidine phosphatase family protein [Gemmatimonadales bacterium]
MKVLVIRHGPAGDPEAWKREGRDDRLRPLSPDGKKDMRQAASGLATLQPHVDVVASSPLVRAIQTAEIIASEYDCEVVTVDELVPDADPARTLEWIGTQRADWTVALVGHEPHLSALVSYMLGRKGSAFVELKKGGACLLEVGSFSPGSSMLKWLLTRRELVRLGE